MPAEIDIFTTRYMLPLVEENMRASSFLRDRYFSKTTIFESKYIDFDVLVHQRQKAVFSNINDGPTILERTGFKTFSFEAPYMNPATITTAEDVINNRLPGDHIYSTRSPQEKMNEILGRDLNRLEHAITRAEEDMIKDLLFYGNIKIEGPGISRSLDFWEGLQTAEKPTTTLTSANYWTASGADPLKDLRDIRRKIVQRSGVGPTDCIMGREAIDAFIANLTLNNKTLDIRRVEMGYVKPNELAPGVIYWGRLLDSGLDIYSYDDVISVNGSEVPVIPTKAVLVGSPRATTTMAYGPCPLVKNNEGLSVVAAARVPSSFVSTNKPAGRVLQLASRPLPILHEIQAFHVLWPLGYTAQS